jgi:hypothetical protein
MLYVNAYLVGQLYGGPEEGGWYYHVWTPLAAIPIPTKREVGQTYSLSISGEKTVITVSPCDLCGGTGDCGPDETHEHGFLCSNENQCSYLPEDLDATAKVVDALVKLFDGSAARHEHIRVALENKFAEAGNDYSPYE